MKKLVKISLLFCVIALFSACDGYPFHTVCEGNKNFIIYKMEKVNKKAGNFKYAVTDASGISWTLYSFQKFNVGDTLYITIKK